MSRNPVIRTIVALAVAGAALLFFAAGASAVSGSLTVESATVAMGDEGTIEVTANVPEAPGLGAWTVDVIVEDPDVVAVLDCNVPGHSVCNPEYALDPPTVRYAGAVAVGIIGETSIGTFTFECLSEGTTVLDLSTTGFADGTLGAPQEIAATHNLGTVTCTEPGASGPIPTNGGGGGTATPLAPSGLPNAGSAGAGGSGSLWAVITLLAGAGSASAAFAYAMRRYASRQQ
jgi:hypothetical protein